MISFSVALWGTPKVAQGSCSPAQTCRQQDHSDLRWEPGGAAGASKPPARTQASTAPLVLLLLCRDRKGRDARWLGSRNKPGRLLAQLHRRPPPTHLKTTSPATGGAYGKTIPLRGDMRASNATERLPRRAGPQQHGPALYGHLARTPSGLCNPRWDARECGQFKAPTGREEKKACCSEGTEGVLAFLRCSQVSRSEGSAQELPQAALFQPMQVTTPWLAMCRHASATGSPCLPIHKQPTSCVVQPLRASPDTGTITLLVRGQTHSWSEALPVAPRAN